MAYFIDPRTCGPLDPEPARTPRQASLASSVFFGRSDLHARIKSKSAEAGTALVLACTHGRKPAVLALLSSENGADGAAKEAALRAALSHGHQWVATRLLDAGADAFAAFAGGPEPPPPAAADDAGPAHSVSWSKAGVACASSSLGKAESAVSAFNKDRRVDPLSGERALHKACAYARADIVAHLLSARISANVDAPDLNGCRPLHVACRMAPAALCKQLIDAGACVDAPDNSGARPLRIAASERGDREIFDLLLAAGARVYLAFAPPELSVKQKPDLSVPAVDCPGKHGLRVWRTRVEGTPACVKCKHEPDRGTRYHVCGACKYHLCDDCHAEVLRARERLVRGQWRPQRPVPKAGAEPLRKGSASLLLSPPPHSAAGVAGVALPLVAAFHDKATPIETISALVEEHAGACGGAATSAARWTALHYASFWDRADGAAVLLKALEAPDVNAPDIDGRPPLHIAARFGKYDHRIGCLRLLVADARVEVTAADLAGRTVLHLLASSDHAAALGLVMPRAKTAIDKGDETGATPLFYAARAGAMDAAAFLLKEGCAPNATDGFGRTCIHDAAVFASGSPKELLRHVEDGVDPHGSLEGLLAAGCESDIRDAAGVSPLLLALSRVLALGSGAGGGVAVGTATAADPVKSALRVATALLNAGASADGALHAAAVADRGDFVDLLLDNGADPDKARGGDPTRSRALHGAAAAGAEKSTAALLHGRANEGATDARGRTALHAACEHGHRACAKQLLDAGADASALDDLGQSPLGCAVACRRTEIVALLLEAGAADDSTERLRAALAASDDASAARAAPAVARAGDLSLLGMWLSSAQGRRILEGRPKRGKRLLEGFKKRRAALMASFPPKADEAAFVAVFGNAALVRAQDPDPPGGLDLALLPRPAARAIGAFAGAQAKAVLAAVAPTVGAAFRRPGSAAAFRCKCLSAAVAGIVAKRLDHTGLAGLDDSGAYRVADAAAAAAVLAALVAAPGESANDDAAADDSGPPPSLKLVSATALRRSGSGAVLRVSAELSGAALAVAKADARRTMWEAGPRHRKAAAACFAALREKVCVTAFARVRVEMQPSAQTRATLDALAQADARVREVCRGGGRSKRARGKAAAGPVGRRSEK